MFEFYIAAREQKETGHPGIFSRQKHSTIIYPRFYVSTSKSIIKALINMHSFEIQLSPIG